MMELSGDYVERLRNVFEVIDDSNKGYISVQHFQSLANEHFGAGESGGEEDLQRIIRVLDPTADGKIHFEDFCEGMKQILELKSPSTPPIFPSSEQPKLYNIGSEETLVPLPHDNDDTNSCGTHETSEVSTYNEYDMMTEDDDALGGSNMSASPPARARSAGSANGDEDKDSAISTRSMDEHTRRVFDVTNEEDKFEDFGMVTESSASASLNASPHVSMNASHLSQNGYHTPDRPLTLQIPGSNSGRSSKNSSFNEADMDEAELKKKRESWIRSRTLSSINSSIANARRLTSSALASHLLRSSGSTGHSRRSSCSDDFYDDIDGSFTELTDKVRQLESQLSCLSEKQVKNDEKQNRLKEENSYLVESRVHVLEEQLREIEMRSTEHLEEERRRHREALTRTDKEKTQEIELLTLSLKTIDQEYRSLKEEAPRLRAENERLRKENTQLEDRLRQAQNRMSALAEEHEESKERLMQEKDAMVKERRANGELLDELSRELEELRLYKQEQETKLAAIQTVNDVPRSQRRQMEAHIVQLRQENSRLREHNDELQATLLSTSVREGRNILGSTLKQELDSLPKDELMRTLHETRMENKKLREYVDIITLRCLEKNPSILEIGENAPSSSSSS